MSFNSMKILFILSSVSVLTNYSVHSQTTENPPNICLNKAATEMLACQKQAKKHWTFTKGQVSPEWNPAKLSYCCGQYETYACYTVVVKKRCTKSEIAIFEKNRNQELIELSDKCNDLPITIWACGSVHLGTTASPQQQTTQNNLNHSNGASTLNMANFVFPIICLILFLKLSC